MARRWVKVRGNKGQKGHLKGLGVFHGFGLTSSL